MKVFNKLRHDAKDQVTDQAVIRLAVGRAGRMPAVPGR